MAWSPRARSTGRRFLPPRNDLPESRASYAWRGLAGGVAFNTTHNDTKTCLPLRGHLFAREPSFSAAKGLCGGWGGGPSPP
jgi:hypothetical protein